MGPFKGELRSAREAFLRADYEQAVQHCNTAIQLSPASYDAQLCVYRSPSSPPFLHPHTVVGAVRPTLLASLVASDSTASLIASAASLNCRDHASACKL